MVKCPNCRGTKWDGPILNALRAAERPMRTGEIVTAVRVAHPAASYMSVFNNVSSMARRGLLTAEGSRPRHTYRPAGDAGRS